MIFKKKVFTFFTGIYESHSGCPVLFGAKWIANKWIREKRQVFSSQCGLVNGK